MVKPSISPKLFEGQEICSLKHDDYLILLKKDYSYLKEIIKQVFKLRRKRELDMDVIVWKDENKGVCSLKSYLETDEGKLIKNYSEKKAPFVEIPLYNSIKIKNWSPEHTIKNNGYYIGSIDLLIKVEMTYKKGLLINEEEGWIWDYFKMGEKEEIYELIFEFKPNIKSYSEVIRQIKVYSSYLDSDIIPICITESDITKFKDIFESQGIYIFNLNEIKKELNSEEIISIPPNYKWIVSETSI